MNVKFIRLPFQGFAPPYWNTFTSETAKCSVLFISFSFSLPIMFYHTMRVLTCLTLAREY